MILVLMGVCGCGKSSLGAVLSEQLKWPLIEGDSFHSEENVLKMKRGEALTDQDRFPWLLRLHDIILRERCRRGNALVTCSALKRQYRDVLLHGNSALASPLAEVPPPADVCFLYLHGDSTVIGRRLAARSGHFLKPSLLRSQVATLEPPSQSENMLALDVSTLTLTELAQEVMSHLTTSTGIDVTSDHTLRK